MTLEVIDFSYARPSPADIKAKYPGVIRYISPDPPSGKIITKAEATALWAEGLSIALVAEGNSAGWMRRGTDYAKTAAGICRAQARAAGFPDSLSIYLAADEDFQPSDQPMLDAFLRAWTKADTAPASIYGGYYVITRCQANKSALRFWQASAWSTDSATRKILVAPGIHLFQTLDKDFWSGGQPGADIDIVYAEDYGQWPKPEGGTPVGDPIAKTRTDYMPAAHDSGGRESSIAYVVIHDGETDERLWTDDAESMGAWFQNKASEGSAHMGADDDTRQRYLADDREAWGAPPLNDSGLHIEQAGKATDSRTSWLAHVGTADAPLMIRRVAWQVADWMRTHAIPNRFLSASDLLATGANPSAPQGWTTHANVTAAFHQSTHTDPGVNYPLDVLGSLITEYLNPQPQPEEDWMAALFETEEEFKNAVRAAIVGAKVGGKEPQISAAEAGFGIRFASALYHYASKGAGSNEVAKVAEYVGQKLGL